MQHVVCPYCDSVNRIPPEKAPVEARCGKCRRPLFGGIPLELSGARFKRHLTRNDIPLLVDFWADWCQPCHMMAPHFEQAAGELEPQFRLAKVNTEKDRNLAAQFAIRSIPTLILFRSGAEVARTSGAMERQSLVAWARQHA